MKSFVSTSIGIVNFKNNIKLIRNSTDRCLNMIDDIIVFFIYLSTYINNAYTPITLVKGQTDDNRQ
mgnify:CR=1 FL=1